MCIMKLPETRLPHPRILSLTNRLPNSCSLLLSPVLSAQIQTSRILWELFDHIRCYPPCLRDTSRGINQLRTQERTEECQTRRV